MMENFHTYSTLCISEIEEFHQLEFVNPYKYICTICQKILRQPYQTPCGHRICYPCFKIEPFEGFPCFAKKDNCVIVNWENIRPDFPITHEMRCSMVYCLNKKHGCSEIIRCKELRSHLLRCTYIASSGFGIQEKASADYSDKFRTEECKFCQSFFLSTELQKHIKNDCPQVLIPCSFKCGMENVRSQIGEHEIICQSQPVECKFWALGCKFQGIRAEIKKHEADYVQNHLDIALSHISRLNGCLESLQKEVHSLKNSDATLTESITQLELNQMALKSHVRNNLMKITYKQRDMNKNYTSDFDLNVLVQKMKETNGESVFIWKISNFNNRCYRSKCVYSPPFYINHYKFCIEMRSCGHSINGHNITMSFVMMIGEYDNVLKWPFKRRVKFILLDQQQEANATCISPNLTINVNLIKPTDSTNNIADDGFYIDHSYLKSHHDRFLKDDTLFFKIIVDN